MYLATMGLKLSILCMVILGMGNAHAKPVDHFFRHSSPGDDHFELWDYQFTLDNGTRAYLTYSLVTLPAIGKKIAAELSFSNWNGKNPSIGRQFPTGEWSEDPATATIRIRNDYYMTGNPTNGHRVYFATQKNKGYLLDLTFSDCFASGDLLTETISNSPFNMIIHIPHGKVQGTIAFGRDTLQVRGHGTLIHTWHSKRITDFASRSIHLTSSKVGPPNGRVLIDKHGKAFGQAIVTQNGKSSIWTPKFIESKGAKATIHWNESPLALELDFSKPRQKYSALANVDSWVERQAAKMVMGGDLILYRGSSSTTMGTIDWIAAGFD